MPKSQDRYAHSADCTVCMHLAHTKSGAQGRRHFAYSALSIGTCMDGAWLKNNINRTGRAVRPHSLCIDPIPQTSMHPCTALWARHPSHPGPAAHRWWLGCCTCTRSCAWCTETLSPLTCCSTGEATSRSATLVSRASSHPAYQTALAGWVPLGGWCWGTQHEYMVQAHVHATNMLDVMFLDHACMRGGSLALRSCAAREHCCSKL